MTRKVVSNTRPIAVFRRIFLLLFFRDSRAGNRCKRTPAVSRIKLKFTEHVQQNAPLLVCVYFLENTIEKSKNVYFISLFLIFCLSMYFIYFSAFIPA